MAKIDGDWAITEIDKFLHVTSQVRGASGGTFGRGSLQMRGSLVEASAAAHVVEQVLDRVLQGWRQNRPDADGGYRWLRDQAARAKAQLQRADELAEKLGDGAPEMDAGNLHPWAWQDGKTLWDTGHYNQAVMQAAIRINAETQVKLGRTDVSEKDLFVQAFSSNNPTAEAPRLRIMEDDGSRTYESIHRGARAFAEGLYAAIRNPGMHVPQTGGGEQQLALEQLAAFSLLARWVDQAKVARA